MKTPPKPGSSSTFYSDSDTSDGMFGAASTSTMHHPPAERVTSMIYTGSLNDDENEQNPYIFRDVIHVYESMDAGLLEGNGTFGARTQQTLRNQGDHQAQNFEAQL